MTRPSPIHLVGKVIPTKTSVPPKGSDPFLITTSNGYLPSRPPLRRLPPAFDSLSNLLDNIPILKQDGSPGLLASFGLGPFIDSGGLPDLISEIDNLVLEDGTIDMPAITAAFRDYSFVASSYLLEPCWEKYSQNPAHGYGLGRQVLPRCIAGPLVKCGAILDIPPFMSYAASYALYNYYLEDPTKGHHDYSNLRLIRAFEHGLDPKSSEAGFILTHIHMVAQTGDLIRGSAEVIEAVSLARSMMPDETTTSEAKQKATTALHLILKSMTLIEANMEKMWTHSLPKDYMSYRTFIYGITSQSMFPSGVVYEGQFDNVPQAFRGESGANDSIIPLLDHLCEIPMPENPLTQILREFREYRPRPHREFLKLIRESSERLGTREFLTSDIGLAVLYIRVLDHVRSFRWRHWQFTREYIIKRTSHPVATGGSPIITWLPNQLGAVMQLMDDVARTSGLWDVIRGGKQKDGKKSALDGAELAVVRDIMENAVSQKEKLEKEVAKYCQDRGV
ncbi:hypothetical protein KVT40_006682 [Elsinoe batatas]|uniref:Indoleamine 2,3-dioxygenase n=1 Tax=Elsinoe batatas TaxID=2601811 RepID=A0A8K0PCT6_9PEZI|nr:hypothetical protein KVT40_006682 [Elsinoe batatas]